MRDSLAIEIDGQVTEQASTALLRILEPRQLVSGSIDRCGPSAGPAHNLLEAPSHRFENLEAVRR
jgi:hypothetical protein